MNNTEKHSDKDWEKLASLFSGETTEPSYELGRFREEDLYSTEKQWNEMGKMRNNNKINVDKAWNSIYSRIEENGLLTKTVTIESRNRIRTLIRIAAAALIIIGLGATMLYLNKTDAFTRKIVVAANSDERNKEVSLPDGSKIYLNRNSELSYNKNMEQLSRNVTLKGEAFFDIKRDPSKPFIIDAGKARVKVLGTSFSVLTSNSHNAVEVFVKTGSVMLSDNSGTQNLVLEPGFIGSMDLNSSAKAVNENPNYLSWNTDTLVYDGKTLDVVFADLKKVYDIDVVADDPEILNDAITTVFDNQPQDTIIRVICTTFNFHYKKEGVVYHLSKR
jgi:ferric-dicitrate binding protein FerR (iron transport regulator)